MSETKKVIIMTVFILTCALQLGFSKDVSTKSEVKRIEDECMAVTEIPKDYEKYLPKERVFQEKSVPKNKNAYAYMWYTTITSTGSKQYFYRQNAETDANGFRRYEGRLLIAVGQYYGKVGDVLRITMDSGLVYEAVIGDSKSNAHTDRTQRVAGDGSIVEFIVDKKTFTASQLKPYRGAIIKIEKEESK